MDIQIKTLAGGDAGSVTLADEIFGLEPREDILQRMVRYQLAKRQQGTHQSLGRAEIARTGAKLYKQKGDAEELKELAELGGQARKKFKSGDLDGAEMQLRSIQPRLEALNKTPGGVAVQRVEELKKVGTMWDSAMSEMGASMREIATRAEAVAAAAGLDAAEVRQQTDKMQAGLQKFRGPLVRNVLLLVDEKTALPARKTAREDALADLRALRGAVSENPLSGRLDCNPFKVAPPAAPAR